MNERPTIPTRMFSAPTRQATPARTVVSRDHRGLTLDWKYLGYAGATLIAVLILLFSVTQALSWVSDVQYGSTRTVQLDAVVGHSDSTDRPTHFVTQNLHGQVFVIELPGSDPTKTMVLMGPRLFGQDAAKMVPAIAIGDLNGDGRPDIKLTIDGSSIAFLNDGTKFAPYSEAVAPASTVGASKPKLEAAELKAPSNAREFIDNVEGASALSADEIDKVLQAWGSPAVGLGKDFISLGAQYNLRAEFALGFFVHESSAGTAGVARTTKSIGNIRCSSGYRCFENFRAYDSWRDGAADWFSLIRKLYVDGWQLRSLSGILAKYAPSADGNDESAYAGAVRNSISAWYRGDYGYKG